MLGRRKFLIIVLILLVRNGNEGCPAHSNESLSRYVRSNFDETFVSEAEGILSVFFGRSPSSESSEPISAILRFFSSFFPVLSGKQFIPLEEKSHTFGTLLNLFGDHLHLIYPGTRWCGDRNINGDKDDDLEIFKRTDDCCSAHDRCNLKLNAGEIRGPLINNGLFTRCHCNCDQEFYQCLKNVDSLVSIQIGMMYFNLLRPQCFKMAHPMIKCEQYDDFRILNSKCRHYSFDGTKQYYLLQWFDNPDF